MKGEGTQLTDISDHNLKVNGSVDLTFKMDSTLLTYPFNIIDDLNADLVIGVNLQNDYNARIWNRQKKMTIEIPKRN